MNWIDIGDGLHIYHVAELFIQEDICMYLILYLLAMFPIHKPGCVDMFFCSAKPWKTNVATFKTVFVKKVLQWDSCKK